MTDHLENSIVKFAEVANSQEKKGITKYGKPLNPLDNYDWLQMALEEQVDGTKYLVAEIEKRKYIVGKIRELLKKDDSVCTLKIERWLKMLEG